MRLNRLILFILLLILTTLHASYRFKNDIFPKIIKYEGREYTNNSWDPGGPTKYGITLRTYNSINKKKVNIEQFKKLSENEAMNFYEDNFWYKYNADNIANDQLATAVILAQINLGPSRPNRLLEQMLNDYCDAKLIPNGSLSNEEVDKINNCHLLVIGFPFLLFNMYKYQVVKSKLWVKIEKGIRNRVMEGIN